MSYLIGLLFRHASRSGAAELLRTGDEHALAVRGRSESQLDSSDDQRTWVPTDSDISDAAVPHKAELARVIWDRELSEILSLDQPDPSTDQHAHAQHYLDSFQNIQDYPNQQQQYSQDSRDADIQVLRPEGQKKKKKNNEKLTRKVDRH